MKTITVLIVFMIVCPWLVAQESNFTEQLPQPANNTSQFVFVVQKQKEQNAQHAPWRKKPQYFKDSTVNNYSIKKLQGQKAYLRSGKLMAQEYKHFKQTILTGGFLEGRMQGETYAELFQKKDITITVAAEAGLETGQWYKVSIEKKALPRIKDLQFAEDLLAFNSHQHLITIFGIDNVQKDLFYAADGTTVSCSVIYPATSREVVFLWHDTANLRQLASIRIGGNWHTAGVRRYNNNVVQSRWLSRQGIYATMTLNQLQSRNSNALYFYGWGGGSSATLCNNNSGQLDFSALDLVFSCLNCNDDAYYGKQQLASDRVIKDGRRVFVTTMIFYPPADGNE